MFNITKITISYGEDFYNPSKDDSEVKITRDRILYHEPNNNILIDKQIDLSSLFTKLVNTLLVYDYNLKEGFKDDNEEIIINAFINNNLIGAYRFYTNFTNYGLNNLNDILIKIFKKSHIKLPKYLI